MARLNQWAFRGSIINGPNVRVRDISGAFGLPPLRGEDFLTMGRTGRVFVPKVHDSREITLEIIVRDVPYGVTPGIFDQIATWATNRTQGALTNILDSGPRTGQAECTAWLPGDMGVGGLTFKGVATFRLADPWLYGPTVTASVTPGNSTITVGPPVVNGFTRANRASFPLAMAGITSGQPILIVFSFPQPTVSVSTVADTFGGHYTWTKVESSTSADIEIWIGTGGTGTSGTVTVTPTISCDCAGIGYPLYGASVAAGLLAVDVHANTSSGIVNLTPSAANELALFAFSAFADDGTPDPLLPTPWVSTHLDEYSTWCATGTTYASPASGVALTPPVDVAYLIANSVGAIIKTGTAGSTSLAVTNPGTATAESMLITLTGPMTNPTISNATTGTSLTILRTVAAGNHEYIDTGAATCKDGAGTNHIGLLTHSGAVPFLTLAPGVNALSLMASNMTGASTLAVSFNPPYE